MFEKFHLFQALFCFRFRAIAPKASSGMLREHDPFAIPFFDHGLSITNRLWVLSRATGRNLVGL